MYKTLHYSHLHLTGETCCFLEKMPPKKKRSRKDVLFKSKLTLQTVKFATPKEIIQYFLFLRQSRGTGVTTSHLVCCPNQAFHFEPSCFKQSNREHCCILSKLIMPWKAGGFRTLSTSVLR